MKFLNRALLASSLFLACAGQAALAQQPEAIVELATVSEQTASSVVRLPGTVISTQDALIAAEISGRLTWVAQVGDHVERGDVLARIDDHLLQLEVRNNIAQIARLEADIQYNKRQIARLQKLALQNNMARAELDEVESRLEMRLQEQRIAEVALDRSRYDLQRAEVTAPFPGVIARRELYTGEYTTPGAALVRLVNTRRVEISVNAPLRIARYNHPGSEVEVAANGEKSINAIRGMVPVGDERSRMMELRLSVDPGQWMIGEAVTVELPDNAASLALSVPRDALVLRENKVFVYTVSEDNTAVKVPVKTLAGRGSRIAIEGDLAVGDAVVIRGAERLRDGQALKVVSHDLAAK
ncbi:efflux RND transporter periplasmic adaptor subunit [Seongchinamella unica]|uniref:Efflux RND transporter periplasmic adaptor subunit n=1 Tax=Seongchinamella unica TaxID=2547392 RepID=A0A4R5LWL2_9GAMM|nr:efflux RND transporter periplasmic adaptor subunit [Seongchinamella unica]TDG15648.1 efflux RND transporter periplasmic adaptor subunit [Seongchinamella unica]